MGTSADANALTTTPFPGSVADTFAGPHGATMSTREVAELTGKEHRHVMRDTRAMLVELHGEGGLPRFGQSYLNSQNKAQPEYLLPKRESLILVSGYNVVNTLLNMGAA